MSKHGTPAAGGRHPVDIGHLVMGIAFLGLVGVWALFEGGAIDGGDLSWFLPIPWLAAGAAGLVALAVASRRRARRTATDEPDALAGHDGYLTEPTDDTTTFDTTTFDTTEESR